MQIKTLKGNTITVDVEACTVTLPQGVFAYSGPHVAYMDGQRINTLEITFNGKPANVALSVEQGDAIYNAQKETAKAKLDTMIPGLDELRDAIYAEISYQDKFERMMDDEHNDGVKSPVCPTIKSADLKAKYPKAAAYLRAEDYTQASNDQKYSAGEKAMALLLEGGSVEDANNILDNWLPKGAFFD